MSVLIKGMEMPKAGCKDCIFAERTPLDHCPFLRIKIEKYMEYGGKPLDCPLVPVPPHSRLIDADALSIYQREERARQEYERDNSDEYLEGILDGLHEAAKQLSTAPTIIEAEEEQE